MSITDLYEVYFYYLTDEEGIMHTLTVSDIDTYINTISDDSEIVILDIKKIH